jgi:septal ring factor EnvC (AmiA/AmiB activator)
MKKSELWTRIALGAVVVAGICAIILQILNEKTNALETTYEIITFSASIIAVSLAILSSLDNGRNQRETKKIAREIREMLREMRGINRDNDKLRAKINEVDLENDDLREMLEKDESLDEKTLEILSGRNGK